MAEVILSVTPNLIITVDEQLRIRQFNNAAEVMFNISAENAFLQTVRECRAETVILFEHLKKALESLKADAEAAGEGYKYEALEAVYIKGKTYEDIVRETGCGRNSPKKWCKVMIARLSIKLFGAKAIENDKIGVK